MPNTSTTTTTVLPIDPMNPAGCFNGSTLNGPEILGISAPTRDLRLGTQAEFSVRFRSPCGINAFVGGNPRLFTTGTAIFLSYLFSPGPTDQVLARFVGAGSSAVDVRAGTSSGALFGTSADLTSGTWVDGTITIRFDVEICNLPQIRWGVLLEDAAGKFGSFDIDRMPSDRPDLIWRCVS